MPPSMTPRSASPVKEPPTQERGEGDISMMVEPPTEFMEDESEHPQEEPTVRLLPQMFHPQPSSSGPSFQQQNQVPGRGEVHESGQDEGAPAGNIQDRRYQTQTPEPLKKRGHKADAQRSPSTPGHIAPFDWDDFEFRYQKALDEADENEKKLLEEFDDLVKYFNAWASASSVHDNDRAVKRLQTRERHVQIKEENLLQKKQHFSEVVKAFQSALALLKAT